MASPFPIPTSQILIYSVTRANLTSVDHKYTGIRSAARREACRDQRLGIALQAPWVSRQVQLNTGAEGEDRRPNVHLAMALPNL